jgi:putative peptidoglycan lipid II flippase
MSTNAAKVAEISVNRGIWNAATAVTVASLLVKLVATVKEFTVAGVYGRSDAMDAFLAAALVPGLLINLISESMNQALVPTLVRVREKQGRESAQQLFSSSMFWTVGMLVAASVVMGLLARTFFPVIGSRFAAEKLDLSVRLFYWMLPTVVLTGIASNCTAVLNTRGSFALPALATIATPAAIMICAPLLVGHMGIWALVCATLIGALVHAGWVASMLQSHEYHFRMRWFGLSEPMREIAHQYGPVLLSSVVASSGLLIDQSMAAMLPAGSVSALAYAGRFVSVVLTLLAGAVSTAVVPYFSEMIGERDWRGCSDTLRTWARITLLVSTPIAMVLIVGAHFLIQTTFQHGAFGVADSAAVTPVLAMYALQIPFFVCSRVFYRFLVAMRRTDLIFYCGLLNLGLDVVLNLVLMRWLGLAGIALATSLWTVSTLIVLWYWSGRVLRSATRSSNLSGGGGIRLDVLR